MKLPSFLLLIILTGCVKDPFLTESKGSFKDSRDKHEYRWVRVGDQIWMADNLAYLPAVAPSSEGSETSPFYYVYNYEGISVPEAKSKENYTSYGSLYNREAALIACPTGWHLPTDAEWETLTTFLSPHPGKKMKADTGWPPNGNGDNISGLNIVPGGTRQSDPARFYRIGENAIYWSSTKDYYDGGIYDFVWSYDSGDEGGRGYSGGAEGYSVRCIKDN